MEGIVRILIFIHVILGSLALIAGPVAAIAKKGRVVHRIAGKIFAFSMIATAVLALVVSLCPGHKSIFLFSVGVFGLYLVASGYRVLKLKDIGRGKQATFLDWGMAIVMGFFGLGMVGYGTFFLINGAIYGLILLVFGGIGLSLAIKDIKVFIHRPKDPRFWLFQHINKMNGALITAVTAFLVNNNTFMPGVLAWLLPTGVGVLLGTYWNKKYKGKLKKGKPQKIRVDVAA